MYEVVVANTYQDAVLRFTIDAASLIFKQRMQDRFGIRRADKCITLVDEKTFHVLSLRHRNNWEVDFEIQALQL